MTLKILIVLFILFGIILLLRNNKNKNITIVTKKQLDNMSIDNKNQTVERHVNDHVKHVIFNNHKKLGFFEGMRLHELAKKNKRKGYTK